MTAPPQRRILVTSALPYANGSLHLGHLLEQVQTDIWVRFQKSRGHDCTYVCADDAHGTAIMLTAEQQGITPEEQIAAIHAEHLRDSTGFHVAFDNFHTTHSPENRYWCEVIYARLKANGHIASRAITQAFDPEKQLFLADRFIKGSCPRCKTPVAVDPGAWQALTRGFEQPLPEHARTAKGCDDCRHTGYHGRTAVYEMLTMTPKLRREIRADIDLPAFAEACQRDGLRPLRVAGAELIARGLTTVKEVVSVLPTID